MKKLMMIAMVSLAGLMAEASTAQPAYVCKIDFSGTSQGAQLLIGSFKTQAKGTLSCLDLTGVVTSTPVNITIASHLLSPTIGLGSFQITGSTAEVSLLNLAPSVLFGKYLVAQGQASLIGGAAAFTAVRVGLPELQLQVSLQVVSGYGVEAGLSTMTISPAN